MKSLILILIAACCLIVSCDHRNHDHKNHEKYSSKKIKNRHAESEPLQVANKSSDLAENNSISDFIYDISELKKDNPGFGTDFFYYPAENGTLEKINLNGNKSVAQDLQNFYDQEEKIDSEQKKRPVGARSRIKGYRDKANAEKKCKGKFSFNRAEIKFIYYSRNYTKGINLEKFDLKTYNASKKTKVVTHGYLSSGTAEICITIKDNYLEVSDVNVIIIDWGDIAGNILYPVPAAATGGVADYASSFLGYLIECVGVKEKDLQLIGHSLGAHVIGFTGKRLLRDGFKNETICVGLDPALPLFDTTHINPNNCKFVQIIHTDSGVLGNGDPLGHVDFYPNNGEAPQPDCVTLLIWTIETCSHSMSWKYYAESVLENHKYQGNCSSTTNGSFIVPMGEATPSSARGICYLSTN